MWHSNIIIVFKLFRQLCWYEKQSLHLVLRQTTRTTLLLFPYTTTISPTITIIIKLRIIYYSKVACLKIKARRNQVMNQLLCAVQGGVLFIQSVSVLFSNCRTDDECRVLHYGHSHSNRRLIHLFKCFFPRKTTMNNINIWKLSPNSNKA